MPGSGVMTAGDDGVTISGERIAAALGPVAQ
jgi:hypothetical protein